MSRRTQAPDLHPAPPGSAATRRDLFGTMGAMFLLTAAEAGPAKAAELDGELLACWAEALLIDRESQRLWEACLALPLDAPNNSPAYLACDAYGARTGGRWHDLVRRISDLPARTPEGLRAKAEAVQAVLATDVPMREPDGTWDSEAQPHERLAMSLCRDVLGRAGA